MIRSKMSHKGCLSQKHMGTSELKNGHSLRLICSNDLLTVPNQFTNVSLSNCDLHRAHAQLENESQGCLSQKHMGTSDLKNGHSLRLICSNDLLIVPNQFTNVSLSGCDLHRAHAQVEDESKRAF